MFKQEMYRSMKKLFLLLFLTACGFSPMYSNRTIDNIDVYVPPISGTNGVDLRNALNAKFGSENRSDATYTLNVKLGSPITHYKAIQSTGDATWQEVQLRADYNLYKGDKKIVSGSETAAESYTFVRYLVAANASYNNAVQNIITVLSDKIGTRIMAETYQVNKE